MRFSCMKSLLNLFARNHMLVTLEDHSWIAGMRTSPREDADRPQVERFDKNYARKEEMAVNVDRVQEIPKSVSSFVYVWP